MSDFIIERSQYIQKLMSFNDTDLIKIITGVRCCGKSTVFDLYVQELLKQEISKELIKQGENLNEQYNEHGWTPFLWLVKEFYEVEIIEEFIKLGGDVNQCTKEKLSPLMIATTHRSSPDVIELLIQYGADVDHQDNYGFTAIMKLIKHPQLAMRKSILQALIDNGCNLTSLRNIQGKSAIDMILEKI